MVRGSSDEAILTISSGGKEVRGSGLDGMREDIGAFLWC